MLDSRNYHNTTYRKLENSLNERLEETSKLFRLVSKNNLNGNKINENFMELNLREPFTLCTLESYCLLVISSQYFEKTSENSLNFPFNGNYYENLRQNYFPSQRFKTNSKRKKAQFPAIITVKALKLNYHKKIIKVN